VRLPTGASLAKGALVVLGVGCVVLVALPYMAPASDTSYAIAWGDRLGHGEVPDFSHPLRAKHPLEVAFAALLSPLGASAAFDVYMVFSVVAFLALLYAIFQLGRVVWAPAIGLLAAALLATRPSLVFYATSCYRDIPFAVFVLLAAALAIENTDRHWRKAMVLLALAGLLRPEAWALSVLYAAWLLTRERRGGTRVDASREALVALALAAPVIWTLFDLILTGDALDTYRSVESDGGSGPAAAGTGAGSSADFYLRVLREGIPGLIGWPLTVLGAAAAAGSLWRLRKRNAARAESQDPLVGVTAVLLALLAFYVLAALFGVAASPRFLIVPAATLVTLATALLALRRVPAVAIALAAAAATVVVALPGDLSDIGTILDQQHERRDRDADLASLASEPSVQAAIDACPRLAVVSGGESFASRGRAIVSPRVGLEPAAIDLRPRPELRRRDSIFLFPSTAGARARGGRHVKRGEWAFISRCR
jgi:hypothetical protein